MATEIDPQRVLSFLDDEAAERLRSYYDPDGGFTGGWFDRLGGGGDAHEVADRFTAEDLVAVAMLSVNIPGRAAIEVLERQSDTLAQLLSDVPFDIPLWDAIDEEVGPESPANELWQRLTSIDDIGWVTAGKLLARKRPHLIPVYDSVVAGALGRQRGDGWWLPLREALQSGADIVGRAADLRDAAGLGDDVSILRVIDVAIWTKARHDASSSKEGNGPT